jgi:hypothetical protein
MPLVSLVTVNYNKKEFTAALLESIKKLNYPKGKIETIIVDNASSDGSQDFFKKKYAWAKLIENKYNAHWCEGVNIGVKQAKGKYVMVLDNDIITHKNFLKELVNVIEKDQSIAAVGPKMFNKYKKYNTYTFEGYGTTTLMQFGALLNISKDTKKLLNLFGTAGNFLYRKNLVNAPYDPEYLAYAEDTYFCWLMRLKGYQLITVPTAILYHEGEVSYGVKDLSEFAVRIAERNRLLNMLFFYEVKNLVKLLPHIIFFNIFINIYDPKRIPLRLRNYGFLLVNFPKILRKRRNIQRQRKVPDKEIIKLMSYKFFEPINFKNKIMKKLVVLLNRVSYAYCAVVGLKTIEFYQSSK